jgi:hypothetical protein
MCTGVDHTELRLLEKQKEGAIQTASFQYLARKADKI